MTQDYARLCYKTRDKMVRILGADSPTLIIKFTMTRAILVSRIIEDKTKHDIRVIFSTMFVTTCEKHVLSYVLLRVVKTVSFQFV